MSKYVPTQEDKRQATRNTLAFAMEVRELGSVPISSKDPNALDLVKSRTDEYYMICQKYGETPTMEGLTLALGLKSRITLYHWKDGYTEWTKKNGITDYIEQQYAFLNEVHVQNMLNGNTDRITGIFLSKNNYDYKNEDPEPVQHQINVKLSIDELIEESKNLLISKD